MTLAANLEFFRMAHPLLDLARMPARAHDVQNLYARGQFEVVRHAEQGGGRTLSGKNMVLRAARGSRRIRAGRPLDSNRRA
jgi:hypothetical protein